jgi:DNA transposition AAA+ family ATPase
MNTPTSKIGTHAPPTIAVLKNVTAIMVLLDKLANRPANLPGIGVMAGHSGYGKTTAAQYAQNKLGAVYIEARHYWTQRTFCEALLHELGVHRPRGTIAAMMGEAIELLADAPERPLIIDEADKLCDKKSIELVRDLYETSGAPVLLVGEELLPRKLAQYERVHNRVLDWVYAQPCDLADCRALAEIICPGLDIADDLLERINRGTHGRARRIATTLHDVAEFARNDGSLVVDAASYQGRIFSGETPRRTERVAP